MTVTREKCGTCHHGAHPHSACVVVEVTGPPSDHPARDGDHGDRTVTPCECKESTPYRNGAEVQVNEVCDNCGKVELCMCNEPRHDL